MMFIDPSGTMWEMEPLLELLKILPWSEIFFTNFIFSGFVLLLVNGVPQLLTAFLLLRRNTHAKKY